MIKKAVVLAAGHGTRLRPFTCATPKPLMPVWGETMLERIVKMLRERGVDDIVVNSHHLHEQIRVWTDEYRKAVQAAGDKVRMDELAYDEKELLEGMRTDPDWYANIDKKVDSPYVIPFVHQKPEVKVGVMGFPEMATREIGEQICREVADSIVKYVDMLNEKNG